MNLKGKVALVTGSGRGIGKAIAVFLAKNGADVVVNDVSLEIAQETAKEIESLGVKTLAVKAFVDKSEEVSMMFNEIEKEFGKLDILVNNAGITRDGFLLKLNEEKWDQVINVNLKGVFNCCQNAARLMSQQNSGKIVNISSIAGQVGNIGQVNYSASKAGVIGMTKTLSKELAQFNVNVNAVAPGFIDTEMTADIPEKLREGAIRQIPLRRAGQPEDIAKLVGFLVSDESDYVSGQIIGCNGGMV